MKRAAKYKRISSDREGRALGVHRQDEDLDSLAAQRGLAIVADYSDNDLSASPHATKPRPDYQRMVAAARAGTFDVIIAYTTGRLTRRPREFEDLIDLAVDHGIQYCFVRSPEFDLNTAQGREMARVLAARDAREAEEISERVRRQKKQAVAAGEWRGGRRPYGYGVKIGTRKVFDKATGEYIERPVYDCGRLVDDEAEEIRYATEQIILGKTLRSLAERLNKRGKTTSTGLPWTATELRRVVRRARNAGLVEVTQEDGTLEVAGEATWPAIVDRAQWEAVCTILDDPDRRTNRTGTARRWLGSGLYRGAECGDLARATKANATVRGGGGTWVYRCKKGTGDGPADARHLGLNAEYVDEVVEAVMLAWLSRPEVTSTLLRPRNNVDTAALRAEEVNLRARLEEADDMFAAGELDRRRLAKISGDVQARLTEIQATLTAAVAVSPLASLVGVDDVAAAWRRLDISQRQEVIEAVAEIRLVPARRGRPAGWRPGDRYFDPASVQVRWREGDIDAGGGMCHG